MKRAFPWLFRNFAGGFLLVLTVQIIVLAVGLNVALAGYAGHQRNELEAIARNILLNPQNEHDEALRYSNPFFVFSANGELRFSNRGKGRSIPEADLFPVRYDGATIGSYHAGEMRFVDNEANRMFLRTLLLLGAASIVAAIAIGVGIAVIASRRIAVPVRLLQHDIAAIESRATIASRRFSITELSEISSALEKLSALLAREEEYKRQWMQDIAHDLRTPISGLKSQIEGMRDGVLETTPERFDRNLSEIDRLQGLVRGISELYAAEQTTSLAIERFSARRFIDEVVGSFEGVARRRRIDANTGIGVEMITGDRELLLRAVGNIVGNAFSYGAEEGSVSIDVREDSGAVVIEISDDGPGIPQGQLDRIFERFYRGEYARNTEGTGLGLNIAKVIVERHGGSISVANREPAGAVFTIRLPEDASV